MWIKWAMERDAPSLQREIAPQCEHDPSEWWFSSFSGAETRLRSRKPLSKPILALCCSHLLRHSLANCSCCCEYHCSCRPNWSFRDHHQLRSLGTLSNSCRSSPSYCATTCALSVSSETTLLTSQHSIPSSQCRFCRTPIQFPRPVTPELHSLDSYNASPRNVAISATHTTQKENGEWSLENRKPGSSSLCTIKSLRIWWREEEQQQSSFKTKNVRPQGCNTSGT